MDKRQLANKIWASANKLRSKIEANEYKDYILGFIFYKFLSDREEKFAREEQFDAETVEKEFYETNAEAVNLVQTHLGYFIAHEHLFSTWLAKGTAFDVSNVRDALSAFTRMIEPSHKKVFANIFNTLETGLGKLGDTSAAQTKAIKALLNLIRDIPMDGRQDYDVLGFVYEYLIGMFAANAGKKAGEFYTPHEVALFMAEIVAEHLKDRKKIKIYDPTSGSGSLLINIGRAVSRYLNNAGIKYYAQELKENTYNLTRMNLVMRGISPANIEVRNGDTLERDWPYFDEANPENTYEPLFVDAVVSNPPYSQHWYPNGRGSDPRYSQFGLAPKSKADYAFLLHDLYHLRTDGIMTIVMPHGVLFRGKPDDGSEGQIRMKLVEGNHIDAIIGLPPNIFFGTGIPTIVMVLRKHRDREDTLIVDASRGFVKDGKKNRLRAADVKRIVDAVVHRTEMPTFSRRVSRDEIRANGYNLNIPRYVRMDESEHWDVRAVMEGGIPNRELDELGCYWAALTGLREAIFETNGNYSALRSNETLTELMASVPSVKVYQKQFADALANFDGYLKHELIEGRDTVVVNAEERILADELFRRVGDLPLVDRYVAYQRLHDAWTQTATDLEILQTDGFDVVRKVDENMVLKKSGDDEIEVQDGWRGRIIPLELMAKTKFVADLEKIAATERAAEQVESELASLVTEVPDDERENVLKEDGEEFDNKKVEEKSKEIAASGEESFDEGSIEVVVLKAKELIAKEKKLRSTTKKLKKELEAKCIEAIEHLTDDEALQLLELKWVKPLVEDLLALPVAVVSELADKIKTLEKKYATTMSDVASRINAAQQELAALTDELTGDADDLAGIAIWRKELAK